MNSFAPSGIRSEDQRFSEREPRSDQCGLAAGEVFATRGRRVKFIKRGRLSLDQTTVGRGLAYAAPKVIDR